MVEIRDLLRLDLQGADLHTLCEAARMLGFEASYGRVRDGMVKSLPMPFIAHLQNAGAGHFVVVHKVGDRRVTIADPAVGLSQLTVLEFQKRWSQCVILLRPGQLFCAQRRRKISLTRRLWQIATLDEQLFVKLASTSALGTALSLIAPLAFMFLMKTSTSTMYRSRTIVGLGLLFALASRLICSLVRTSISRRYSETIDISLGTTYLRCLVALPLREVERRSPGDLCSRLLDISQVRSAIASSVLSFAISCLTYFIALCILVRTSFPLAAICLAATPLAWLVLSRSSQRIAELQHDLHRRIGASASITVETLSCMRAVKAMACESRILERLTTSYSVAQRAAHRRDFTASSINIVVAVFSGLSMIVLLLAGFAMVTRGTITLSRLFICTTLTGLIWGTLEGGIPAIVAVREALESLARVDDVVQLSEGVELISRELKPMPASKMGIEELAVEQISYSYRNSPVLVSMSVEFKQGETVAVLGKSGCGKSTLACILAGLFVPDSGVILVDGSAVSSQFLRATVEVVFQDANIMSGSIRDNLTLGGKSVGSEEMEFAARQACAHEFITQLPSDYDYDVGTYGVGLSTGQRQRIALARAFLSRPPVLILDEATSAIDPGTEDAILENFKRARSALITIIITHRPKNAMKSDRCLVLDRGVVQQKGTYHELFGNAGRSESVPMPVAPQVDTLPV